MFPTFRRLAAHSARDISLLPPIHLYRRLLRANRHKLPPDLRIYADEYIKSEFRLHRDITNPLHIIGFLTEWQKYAQDLEGDTWREGKLDTAKLDKMTDDQIMQLYELMKTVKGGGEGGGPKGDEGPTGSNL